MADVLDRHGSTASMVEDIFIMGSTVRGPSGLTLFV
jgi:hypothetical protein